MQSLPGALVDKKNQQDLFNKLKSGEMSIEEALAAPPKIPTISSGAALNRRTYTSKSIEQRSKQYEKERDLRQRAIERRLSFISPEFDSIYQLTQGLILVGARSGHAKSTTAANVVAGFLEQTKGDSALVISNEESSEAVYNRIACVQLKKNFKALHHGNMSPRDQGMIKAQVDDIVKRIEVVDDDAWDMTCLEDVQAVLEFAAKGGIRLVVIDYLQTVAFSREKPQLEPFQVSKMLGLYLKDYGKRVGVPVLVFAQLKAEDGGGDFSSRVQNDKTIYNHAFGVVELVPDFKNRTTTFIFHKNRFGTEQGAKITMRFVEGRYEGVEVTL